MTDKNDALFLVRLPFGQKTIPYEEVPELIAMAKSPGYDGEHEAVMLELDVCHEEGLLRAAVQAGEVEVLDKSLHRMTQPFNGRLKDTVLTVQALRGYVESIKGFLEAGAGTSPSGDSSETLADFHAMDKLTADELSIAFVGDKFESNSVVGVNSFLEISARNVKRKIALSKLDLVNAQSGGLNAQGVTLLGMAGRRITLNTDANAQKISRLRKIFLKYLGVTLDPFDSKDAKWAPRFTIADKRGAADERAKQDALKYKTNSYEQLNESGEKAGDANDQPYEDEGDDAAEWLSNDSKA